MADEPTLPHFPSVSWNSETQSFNNTSKRVRDGDRESAAAHLFSNSSDPAMFSSDDDPNLENYTQGRHRKKRYVGSWFQQQPASGDSGFSDEVRLPKPKRRRTFERTVDSGVWMGSDASTDWELEDSLPQPTASRLPQLNVSRQPTAISKAEELAREKIFDAIENGEEDIYLTSMNLEQLSNATIAPLAELTCIPTVTAGVPFEQKDPSLKIYLSQNPLTKVPGAMFNLEFLTYLSLRNTKLTEIPPAISKLRNLVTLNISTNRLRYLPGELLDLITYPSKLKELLILPNPFFEPVKDGEQHLPVDETEWPGLENALLLIEKPIVGGQSVMKLWLDRQDELRDEDEYLPFRESGRCIWRAGIRARTPVQFEDSRGVISSNYSLPDCRLSSATAIATEDLTQPPSTPLTGTSSTTSKTASRVPSLLELALQSCSRTSQLPYLPSYLPDDAPAHLPDLLRRIVTQGDANADEGSLPCSKCQKRVVVPVAQWIEWWDLRKLKVQINAGEIASRFVDNKGSVPFIKRACSYRCLPEATKIGTLLPGTLRFSLEKSDPLA